MKILKTIIAICLIVSISFNVFQYQKEQTAHENYRKQEQVLKSKIYELEEEQWDCFDENKNLLLEIESYKFIFDSLEENIFEKNTQEVLKRTYSFETSISFGVESIPIPQSGIIYITGNSFEFDAKVIKPPKLKSQQVNALLQRFDISPLHREIYYPLPDDFLLDVNSVHLEYNDLEINEVIKLRPTEVFKENFKINSDSIEIHVVDENDYAKGSDYFPSKPMTVYYAYDNSVHDYIYEYYKFEDNFLYVEARSHGNKNEILYNVSDGAVTYTHLHTNGEMPSEYLILPKLILLGYEWGNDFESRVITNMDVQISTPAGKFDCVEVTTYYSDEEVNKSYYSKGMGLIKESNKYVINEIIKIEEN